MQSFPAQPAPLWPLVLYFAAVVVWVSGMLGLSYLLGQRQKHKPDEEPYESGMLPTGTTPFHFDVLFYLNAIFFVVFDLELVSITGAQKKWANASPGTLTSLTLTRSTTWAGS